jgi:uncharacterized membrane protein YjgN (DUF898 family)
LTGVFFGNSIPRGIPMAKYKFVNTLSFGDIFVQALIWVILIVITFGLATPFFAYYFLKLIINNTELHEI